MAFSRIVRYERVVQDYLTQEIRNHRRLAEVLRALEWRLARQPEIGYQIPNLTPPRFLAKSLPYRFPIPLVLTLMYQYTDEEVIVELARVDADSGD